MRSEGGWIEIGLIIAWVMPFRAAQDTYQPVAAFWRVDVEHAG